MLSSFESPKSLLNHSRYFNDYDYALVHLFEKDLDYFSFFKKSIKEGRNVYLDNSVFELGNHFDEDRCKYWINELKPTYFIIPDRFKDSNYSIGKIKEWSPYLKKQGIKSIGVLQGSTIEDFINMYKEVEPLCDMIAISFAQPLYEELFPELDKDHARMYGRIRLISTLKKNNIINVNKKHHLLGLSLPQELLFYKNDNWIYSVDSSSPVVHGCMGIKYDSFGLSKKNHTKMIDIYNNNYEYNDTIKQNIKIFKSFI